MRKLLLLLVLLIAGGTLAPVKHHHDDALPTLHVTVRSQAGKQITRAGVEAFGGGVSQVDAENTLFIEQGLYSCVQDPYLGVPLEVAVPMSSHIREAMLYRYQASYFQYAQLVVVVHYRDGTRHGVLVEIPDMRACRTLAVVVP